MALYESVFIARQDASSTQVEALAEEMAGVIASGGGSVTKREFWGLRNLAYRIRKNRKGHYVLFNIDAPAAAIHEMERRMRINEDVVRFLTIKVDALDEGQSAILTQKNDRTERPARPGGRGGFGGGRRERGDRPERAERSESAPSSAPSE